MICFRESVWKDYLDWQQTNRKIVQRINLLIKDIRRHPFEGIGKPEPLKFNLTGLWSRHIDEEHRLVTLLRVMISLSSSADTIID